MNDLVWVQVFQRTNNLWNIALNLELGESFSPFYELIKSLIRTQFQHYINILRILENMFELDHM